MAGAPRALFFDVFGTLVDWRGSIAAGAEDVLGSRPGLDFGAFADAWRDEYQPAMEAVRAGGRGFVRLDVLHAENLARILPRFGLGGLDAETMGELVALWHALDAWPDVTMGLARLRTRFRVAPVSNGNVAIMADLARHNGFLWDAVLGAEFSRDYKPKPRVYLDAAAAFGLPPDRCVMVAAHSGDLAAAKACGLMTAHVARPDEGGPGGGERAPSIDVDFVARDLIDLASLLGSALEDADG
ncbi:MAG: haloacid dehalogenase type II [Hyphomicrobiales bacterium]|nr:haloacid dehalogenase type II [Hyphomicrobiales bacterium]MDE2018506.1 haloacid dehalogenase type II [Hyphomicrobiales bacterium]